jgi:hypothetical protein
MHTFIDESGSFIPNTGRDAKFSAVVSLSVPSSTVADLESQFIRLRRQFGGVGSELKGSKLTERQVAGVISLLREFDTVVDATVLDPVLMPEGEATRFRLLQADSIVDDLPSDVHPTVLAKFEELKVVIQRLPDQLFIQGHLTIAHIRRLLDSLTLYYAQRSPAELSEFVWTVDAKERQPTPSEVLWSTLILPYLHDRPIMLVEGIDYSSLERFAVRVPSSEPNETVVDGFDLKAMLTEQLTFRDSRDVPGLQLVDIVASALTRALNNSLGKDGWQHLGRLFIKRRSGTVGVSTLRAGPADATLKLTRHAPNVAKVIAEIETKARPMLTAATMGRRGLVAKAV